MVDIRYAQAEDTNFWLELDAHISGTELARKIHCRMAYVLLSEGRAAGILRYGLFWDNTPFCNLLAVSPQFRGKGMGRLLMRRWEEDMRIHGFTLVMTSTRADEAAQHFYRKLGYRDAGCLLIPSQPAEIFLIRELHEEPKV